MTGLRDRSRGRGISVAGAADVTTADPATGRGLCRAGRRARCVRGRAGLCSCNGTVRRAMGDDVGVERDDTPADAYRLALEVGGVGVWVWEVDADGATWSPGWTSLLGYRREELAGDLEGSVDLVQNG